MNMETKISVAPLNLTVWQKFRNSHFSYSFRRDKVAISSAIILLIFLFSAFCAPIIAPHNPYDLATIDILDSEIPPIWEDQGNSRFLLGTDAQGRDLLSTILYGTRISLSIGIFAVLLQCFLGVVIGLSAGYFGGRLDSFLMRAADIQLSFSTLMVAIVILALFQALFGTELYSKVAIYMLILVIGIAEWPQYARTIRASTLAEKHKEYIEAANVMGFSNFRIMWVHILPNTISPLLVFLRFKLQMP